MAASRRYVDCPQEVGQRAIPIPNWHKLRPNNMMLIWGDLSAKVPLMSLASSSRLQTRRDCYAPVDGQTCQRLFCTVSGASTEVSFLPRAPGRRSIGHAAAWDDNALQLCPRAGGAGVEQDSIHRQLC